MAYVDVSSPKLVLTFIDNSTAFHNLASRYKKIPFFAVQNGSRGFQFVTDKKFIIPHYFCFGEFEREHAKKNGHLVDNFYPVGAVLGSYAQKTYKVHLSQKQYDLCLIGSWRDDYLTKAGNQQKYLATRTLYEYFARIVKAENLRACYAVKPREGVRPSEHELKFIDKVFDGSADIIYSSHAEMSTYKAMGKSKLILTFFSTAGLEAFGWRSKVLLCNYAGDPKYQIGPIGIWQISTGGYLSFRERVVKILSMTAEEYENVTRSVRKYLMAYPEAGSTGDKINQELSKYINQ